MTVGTPGGSAMAMVVANIPWGAAGFSDPVAILISPTGFQYPALMFASPANASNPAPLGAFWNYHQQIDRLAGPWRIRLGSRNRFASPSLARGEFQFHVSY